MFDRLARRALAFTGLTILTFGGSSCGGNSDQPKAPPSSESSASDRAAAPDTPGQALVQSKVYDSSGNELTCEAPKRDCPRVVASADFLDRCRLAGYQVRHCGCEDLCAGNVKVKKPYYDAKGAAKECAPQDRNCTPPDTSAAFQDACNEHHHKLVICGCEWLCDGPAR